MASSDEFWTIEEADAGGMLGGYPRWLSPDGWYSETDPSKFRRFATREELEASPEWEKVRSRGDYKIVRLVKQFKPLTPDERTQRLAQIEQLFDEVERGRSWWAFQRG